MDSQVAQCFPCTTALQNSTGGPQTRVKQHLPAVIKLCTCASTRAPDSAPPPSLLGSQPPSRSSLMCPSAWTSQPNYHSRPLLPWRTGANKLRRPSNNGLLARLNTSRRAKRWMILSTFKTSIRRSSPPTTSAPFHARYLFQPQLYC